MNETSWIPVWKRKPSDNMEIIIKMSFFVTNEDTKEKTLISIHTFHGTYKSNKDEVILFYSKRKIDFSKVNYWKPAYII